MPDETLVDGKLAALDEEDRPSFNALQNHGSAVVPVHFFIFDLLLLQGRSAMMPTLFSSTSFEPHQQPDQCSIPLLHANAGEQSRGRRRE
jgi:hypothetical protein